MRNTKLQTERVWVGDYQMPGQGGSRNQQSIPEKKGKWDSRTK